MHCLVTSAFLILTGSLLSYADTDSTNSINDIARSKALSMMQYRWQTYGEQELQNAGIYLTKSRLIIMRRLFKKGKVEQRGGKNVRIVFDYNGIKLSDKELSHQSIHEKCKSERPGTVSRCFFEITAIVEYLAFHIFHEKKANRPIKLIPGNLYNNQPQCDKHLFPSEKRLCDQIVAVFRTNMELHEKVWKSRFAESYAQINDIKTEHLYPEYFRNFQKNRYAIFRKTLVDKQPAKEVVERRIENSFTDVYSNDRAMPEEQEEKSFSAR